LILSLFPGIGLLDLAFEQEGFCVVRGPNVLWGGDIRKFHPPASKFNGVIGGPPCQCFSSLAHLVRANGHEPKFGNLIPEFERCVAEAQPEWFLMENVPAAPEPAVEGYGVKSFLLDNSSLDGGDGFGLEQRRVRRFSFALRGRKDVPSLMRWIDLATFLLPDAQPCLLQATVSFAKDGFQHSKEGRERKCRREAPVGHGQPPSVRDNVKRTARISTVCSTMGGKGGKKNFGAGGRYRLADALGLQGLPEDFLDHAPFTAEGKLKAVANGVPLPMGRAIARAVKEAAAGV